MTAQQYRECADRHEHAAQLLRAAADALEPASDHVKALVDASIIPDHDEDVRTYECPVNRCGQLVRVDERHTAPARGPVPRHECRVVRVEEGVAVIHAAAGDNLQDRFETAATLP